MRTRSSYVLLCVFFFLIWGLFPPSAHAYIDPGTGSYVLQIVIAGIAAGALAIKIFWSRIKSLFSGNRSRDNSDQDLNE